MAAKRMFSGAVVCSDAYMDIGVGAKNLYFYLNMQADDDGFVDSPRMVMRTVGSKETDLEELVERGFLLPFGNGVVVITHWRVHNQLSKNRHTPTRYQDLLRELKILDCGEYRRRTREDAPSGCA